MKFRVTHDLVRPWSGIRTWRSGLAGLSLVLVFLVAVRPVDAQEAQGDWWLGISEPNRWVFLEGYFFGVEDMFQRGFRSVLLHSRGGEKLDSDLLATMRIHRDSLLGSPRLTAQLVAAQVTLLYNDPANRKLSLDVVVQAAVLRIEGLPPDRLERWLAAARKFHRETERLQQQLDRDRQ